MEYGQRTYVSHSMQYWELIKKFDGVWIIMWCDVYNINVLYNQWVTMSYNINYHSSTPSPAIHIHQYYIMLVLVLNCMLIYPPQYSILYYIYIHLAPLVSLLYHLYCMQRILSHIDPYLVPQDHHTSSVYTNSVELQPS